MQSIGGIQYNKCRVKIDISVYTSVAYAAHATFYEVEFGSSSLTTNCTNSYSRLAKFIDHFFDLVSFRIDLRKRKFPTLSPVLLIESFLSSISLIIITALLIFSLVNPYVFKLLKMSVTFQNSIVCINLKAKSSNW
jgi:hypothetical protein